MPEFEDKELVCIDCEEVFLLPASEQAFFAEKELTMPKRCKSCRALKKLQRKSQGA
jgi:hypothetical protein